MNQNRKVRSGIQTAEEIREAKNERKAMIDASRYAQAMMNPEEAKKDDLISKKSELLRGYYEEDMGQSEKNQEEKAMARQVAYLKEFGCQLDAFSTRDEEEMGRIDEHGFYVQDKEAGKEAQDAWLDQTKPLSLEELEKAQKAHEQQAKLMKAFDSKIEMPVWEKEERLQAILSLMEAENANKLSNLMTKLKEKANEYKQKFVNKKKNIRKAEREKLEELAKSQMSVESTGNAAEAKEKLEKLIEICDSLCANGYSEIYEDDKEDIQGYLQIISRQKRSNPRNDAKNPGTNSVENLKNRQNGEEIKGSVGEKRSSELLGRAVDGLREAVEKKELDENDIDNIF